MRRVARTVGAFLARDFQNEVSYRFAFVLQMGGILFSAAMWYFIANFVETAAAGDSLRESLGGLDYFPYALVGIAVMGYFNAALGSFAAKLRYEQTTGTLEAMLVTPTSVGTIMVASATWDFLFTSLRFVVYLAFGVLVFGLELRPGSPVGLLLGVLLTVTAFSGVGILAAAFILRFKRGNPVNFFLSSAGFLFGSVIFPANEATMGALAPISRLVPITYANRVVRRSLLQEVSFGELLPDLGALLVFAVVFLPVGILAARIAIRRAKAEGTLIQY
jgi:ABC-2 type transport system permease protein